MQIAGGHAHAYVAPEKEFRILRQCHVPDMLSIMPAGDMLIIVRTLEESEDDVPLWQCPLCTFAYACSSQVSKRCTATCTRYTVEKLLNMNSVAYLAAFWLRDQMCLRLVDMLAFDPKQNHLPSSVQIPGNPTGPHSLLLATLTTSAWT